MSLLTIVGDAAVQAGLSRPNAAASSSDQTASELFFYANLAVEELRAWHDWTMLAVSGTITGDGTTQEWDLPADFDRFAKGQSLQRSGASFYKLAGPLNAIDRNEQIARATISPYNTFWLRGGKIVIYPPMGTGTVVKYEYQSKNAIKASDGTPKSRFDNDADTCLLDESLVAICTAYLWRESKGTDASVLYDRYRQRAQLLAGRDTSLKPVATGRSDFDLPPLMIPDTIVIP